MFLTKPFFKWSKSQDKKLNILRTRWAFKTKQKRTFHHFWRAFSCQKFLKFQRFTAFLLSLNAKACFLILTSNNLQNFVLVNGGGLLEQKKWTLYAAKLCNKLLTTNKPIQGFWWNLGLERFKINITPNGPLCTYLSVSFTNLFRISWPESMG